jgi:hypothetical protein
MAPRKRVPLVSNITPEEWDRIVAVYARHHGYSYAVAVELGWPIARARRVYMRGYKSLGLPPIKTLLAKDALSAEQIRAKRASMDAELPPTEEVTSIEQIESKATVIHAAEQARVRELVRLEEVREKAREDAVKSRADEALLISINRKNAMALNGVTASLMKGAIALSARIQTELEAAAFSGELTVQEKLNLVKSAASVARFNSEATMLAIKSERMVLGAPIDVPAESGVDGSLEQAVEWIERSVRVVQRARDRGLLQATNNPDPDSQKH